MPEKYNKLVRDKIPESLTARGIPFELRIADDEEYLLELAKKAVEEAREFTKDPSVEELADLIEVVETLKKLPQYATVEEVRAEKAMTHGSFDKRYIAKGEK